MSKFEDQRPLESEQAGSGRSGDEAVAGSPVGSELEAAREEAAQYKDRWIRERADLENFKKRAARDREEAARYGAQHLVRDLLPVVDDLERALAAAREAPGGEAVAAGVELVLRGFIDVLERHGVARVPATGERFDPTVHEAVSSIEHPEVPEGMVVEEHRGGYRLHDRLVRAAMVTVSKGNSGDDLANPQDRD